MEDLVFRPVHLFLLIYFLSHCQCQCQRQPNDDPSRPWLTNGYDPDNVAYRFCKPDYTPAPTPPPPPTTTSTTTTTTPTTTTTTPSTTTSNSTETTTTSTTTTSTTSTTTTSTTTTTTTTTTRWVDSCPRQKFQDYFKQGEPPESWIWTTRLETEPLHNWGHLMRQMCPVYFTGMLFQKWVKHPDVAAAGYDKMDSCLNPLSIKPGEWTGEKMAEFVENPLELEPLKQRRTFGKEPEIFEDRWLPVECPDLTLDHRNQFCYNCRKSTTAILGQQFADNSRRGTVLPFVEWGETCTVENEAYLHGAVLMDILDKAQKGDLKLPQNKVYIGDDDEEEDYDFDDPDADIPPWGRLHGYWPRLFNLNLAGIDKNNEDPESPVPDCAFIDDADRDTRLRKEMYYGDCIFNQRLATEGKPEKVETLRHAHCYPDRTPPPTTTTTTTNTTSSTTTTESTTTTTTTEADNPPGLGRRRRSLPKRRPRQLPARQEIVSNWNERVQLEYDVPLVGLGCNPIHLLSCLQEYNEDQMLDSRCICNPMYSMENPAYRPRYDNDNKILSKVETQERKSLEDAVYKKYNMTSPDQKELIKEKIPCFPMAGVPCKFNRTGTKIDEWLPDYELPCADPDLMECVEIRNMTIPDVKTLDDKWRFFSKPFEGFAMSPIARDYMVERATHVCMCKGRFTTHIQSAFNECVAREAGVRLGPSWFLLILAASVAMV